VKKPYTANAYDEHLFFNNGKPKILFQETPLGNNSDIFNKKKTTIITQTEVPLRKSLK